MLKKDTFLADSKCHCFCSTVVQNFHEHFDGMALRGLCEKRVIGHLLSLNCFFKYFQKIFFIQQKS
uniref:Uncharacterized protein n=1 Tax=Marseillevirus sp. TaxID=2809551 RepID=A0AA96IZ64_9VIRU|nr:hypothetical protein MarDSR_270 [Marseillevirus sp.]